MKLKYVFIRGTAGWGSYDKRYEKLPYWGMRGGDLISFLNEKGFDSYASSVSPFDGELVMMSMDNILDCVVNQAASMGILIEVQAAGK